MIATPRTPFALGYPRALFLLCALGILLVGCSGSLNVKPPREVDLSGQWKLNESLSDDPVAVLKQRREEARQSAGGSGGGRGGARFPGGGRGGMGGMGGMGGGRRQGGGARAGTGSATSINDYLARPTQIAIEQMPQELRMVTDGSPTEFLYGEKVVVSVASGVAERVSGWKSKGFVVDYKVKDGRGATRRYESAESGKQLIVTTKVTGGRGPELEFRSVYEREASSS